jgi:hypothetical protein
LITDRVSSTGSHSAKASWSCKISIDASMVPAIFAGLTNSSLIVGPSEGFAAPSATLVASLVFVVCCRYAADGPVMAMVGIFANNRNGSYGLPYCRGLGWPATGC